MPDRHRQQAYRRAAQLLGRCFQVAPRLYWARMSRLTQNQGLDDLYLLISFDCDTPADIEAAPIVQAQMAARGIPTAYAVPGKMLEAGHTTYQALADGGATFLNHGYRPHAEWRDGRFWPVGFYHQASLAEIEDDLDRGADCLTGVIGIQPYGFRAPHFGSFQAPDQIGWLHRRLADRGYAYSSSTLPWQGFLRGPAWLDHGIWEIPLSGTVRSPLAILDSWGHLESPYNLVLRPSFQERLEQTVRCLRRWRVRGVLNYYVDPSHVLHSPGFLGAIDFTLHQGVRPISFADLLSGMTRSASAAAAMRTP